MASSDISQNSLNSFPGSVIEWGESGSFTASLKLDDASAEKLHIVQSQILVAECDSHPDRQLPPFSERGLTLPFFYFEPQVLRDAIVEKGYCEGLNKRNFYQNLVDNTCRLMLSHVNEDIPVEGIELEGQKKLQSVSLKLGQSANLAVLIDRAKAFLEYTLTGLNQPGLSDEQLGNLVEDPLIGRSFEVPEQRIVLARDISPECLPEVELPTSLHFNQVVINSSDPRWQGNRDWYFKQEETEPLTN